ncbi:GRIP and coiled-coil domain-containing protein 2 [Musca vetustissima]|uniref:GRIP and coiled-coil domain-containing protein 2 n=1 Tax=Musca vetustissima TaxID=27455 RepID=UPI002AB66DB4|nr:GRIP and coiled-coil domain-containing protein 2 [Musca vetustissima]
MDTSVQGQPKQTLESLSKDEIINKYKGLLGIAKKAKQAKDEMLEENRKLKEELQKCETQKEADKNALMTMKEMLEAYTEHKLQLTTQLSELEKRRKQDNEQLEKLSIENESLKRQISRLNDDNDSLLRDIENMECQLQQVSGLGKEQKQHLVMLEDEINKLREAEMANKQLTERNNELTKSLDELKEKYSFIKEINTEQRHKFNALKDRFIEVHKKVKKLKECKRILLETQHEYADSVSQWQMEIIKASKLLCQELDSLKLENTKLLEKLENQKPIEVIIEKVGALMKLTEKVKNEYNIITKENAELKEKLSKVNNNGLLVSSGNTNLCEEKLDKLLALSKLAMTEYENLKTSKNNSSPDVNEESLSQYIVPKLEILNNLANRAKNEYQLKSKELCELREEKENVKTNSTCMGCEAKLAAIEKLEEDVQRLTMANVKTNSTCTNCKAKLSVIEKLEEDVQRLTMENDSLQKDIMTKSNSTSQQDMENIVQLKEELETCKKSANNFQEMYQQKEREHYELLDEMRELNEALKARGDLISRQQEEQQQLKNELKITSEKLELIQGELSAKQQEFTEKQESFERLTKLQQEESKQKLEKLETTNNLNEEKLRILNTELEILKNSTQNNAADILDNQSEVLSTSTISRADELQRLKDVEDSFEEKYNKLRALAAKLKKKLQDEVGVKQNLEKELDQMKSNESEMKIQIRELQKRIDDLDMQLLEKQKLADTLKSENQKLKSSRKQANVLNLEIEAAEKSLTEVNNKLAKRTSELDNAQAEIKTKDLTIIQLRKEIELLESSKAAETKHSQELKDQIDHLQKTIKDTVHSKQQALEKSKILEQDVENLKMELEAAKFELSNATCNLEQSLGQIKAEKEQLTEQLAANQIKLSECEQKLKHAERATEDLRVEYLDYKVKAQAVLRKNQNRDSTKERELEEEIVTLRATETQLKTTIDTLTTKLQSVENEKANVQEEQQLVKKRCSELMQLVEEMRKQNDTLNQEVQQHIKQQNEILKQHRQQIETMDECHKDQVKALNANHQRQLEQLRKDLAASNLRLPTTIGGTDTTTTRMDHHQQQQHIVGDHSNYLLMEREDAEGSEEAAETLASLAASRKISNASSKRSHDFMPLDELLNTPINAINSETLISNALHIPDNLNNNSDLLQLELNSTKERLQKQESRVRHLTALLAENEQDLAKLTQMNDMLKEELRRQERSAEREQHLHNSEYVKNVILKFLTLNNADEKTRLVPVLNTLLKLSRTETEMLNCVAKGQKVAETTTSAQRSGGWGNFLPWSGGSNNN